MERKIFLVPVGAVEIEAIFRERKEIARAEIGAARLAGLAHAFGTRPAAVGSRLAKVVDARPHEFSADIRILFQTLELDVRYVAPVRRVAVVGVDSDFPDRIVDAVRRKAVRIETVFGNRRRRLGIEDGLVGMSLLHVLIRAAVVPSRDVEIDEIAARRALLVAAADSDRARRVDGANRIAEARAALGRRAVCGRMRPLVLARLEPAAGRDLVADGPHEDARMVAVAAYVVLQVLFDELLKRLVLASRRPVPLVEALVPDEEPHLVAEVEHLRGGRIVRCADGVHAHVLHDAELAAHRGLVERHAEDAEVGMEVRAL